MHVWCKNSSEQVLTNARPGKEDCATLDLYSARNMTVSAQICMRYHLGFEILGVQATNLPKGVTFSYNYAECITFNDGIPYPDILSYPRISQAFCRLKHIRLHSMLLLSP